MPATSAFAIDRPSSYNSATSVTVFDSPGHSHVVSLYFVKASTTNGGRQQVNVDGTATGNVDLGGGGGTPATLDSTRRQPHHHACR